MGGGLRVGGNEEPWGVRLRARIWPMAIGNMLHITPEVYELYRGRVASARRDGSRDEHTQARARACVRMCARGARVCVCVLAGGGAPHSAP